MNHDRNLLFGIVALQMDFIRRDELIQAMHAWILDKTKPLGQILVEKSRLTPVRRQVLEALVEEHLATHAQDARQSLAALAVPPADLRAIARSVADVEVQASLSSIPNAGSTDLDTTVDHISSDAGSGRYRILRPHAKGGLGEVFVAFDEELHREVALKAIRLDHSGDAASRSRFLLEAEITGGLEHPGIVPVYGFGHYSDGRPYYAMRFLKSDNLKQALSRFYQKQGQSRDPGQRWLEFRQLLQRFIDVCNTVAYAHSRGVLHRDLKPGNVMLGSYGETLLVDWGLAKALGRGGEVGSKAQSEATLQPASGSSEGMTHAGQVLGTPAYMSPEQAAGATAQVGLASDIYSLGATLYVILTGQAPVASGDTAEVLEMVRRGAIPPPRQVRPDTPLALDAICRKAMALRPSDRYASALDLAADIEHWLGDEAVTAYSEPWPARLGRWGRRHRTMLASAAVLLLASLVGLTTGTILLSRANDQTRKQEQEAARQRDLAEENFRQARAAVDEYFVKVSENNLLQSPLPGLQPLRKELLEAALKYYQQFAILQQGKPELQEDLANAYYRAAEINRIVASHQDSESQAEKAIAILESLVEGEPAKAAVTELLARSYSVLGKVRGLNGHLKEGLAALDKARHCCERLLRQEPSKAQWQFLMAALHIETGTLCAFAAEPGPAVQAFESAVALLEPLARHHTDNSDFASKLALAYKDIGDVQGVTQNQPEKALKSLLRGLPLQEKLTRDYPADVNYQDTLASFYSNLMTDYDDIHQDGEAAQYLQKVLLIREKLAHENPSVADFQHRLANVYRLAGRRLRIKNQAPEALAFFNKALPLREKLMADYPNHRPYVEDLALLVNSMALLQQQMRLPKEAQNSFERAAAVLEKLLRTESTNARTRLYTALVYLNLGILIRNGQSRPTDSEKTLERWPPPSRAMDQAELAKAFQTLRRSHELLSGVVDEQPKEDAFRGYLALCSLRLARRGLRRAKQTNRSRWSAETSARTGGDTEKTDQQ
jgi:serine/threonine-protein kinase